MPGYLLPTVNSDRQSNLTTIEFKDVVDRSPILADSNLLDHSFQK